MLHKAIAKNAKIRAKGAEGGINYLTGYKWRAVKPEVLRGNIELTRALLKQQKSDNAYTHGVLSFEENARDVSQAAQDFAMSLVEETLMAGFPVHHYDIVWIRHTDKDFDPKRGCGRLELNYHIVNMDLVTGKVITPYLHKRDMQRINLAKQIINDKFNITSPDDPVHHRQINLEGYGAEYKGVAKQLTDFILDGIATDLINNRQDIIHALKTHPNVDSIKDSQPDTYLVIKLKGAKRNLRLKGTIYDKNQFTSVEQLITRQATSSRGYHEQRNKRLKQNVEMLRALNYQVAQQRAELIQTKRKRGRKPASGTSNPSAEEQRSFDSVKQKHSGKQRTIIDPQSKTGGEVHGATTSVPLFCTDREHEVGQNPFCGKSFSSAGVSIWGCRDLPFRGLDFSCSLKTKLVNGRKLTRAQRQWYAVYKQGIEQEVVHDAIILDKGGFGANRTILSQRLNTVIREYDDLFTVSSDSSPEAKKHAYLLTIEAAVAKGWEVSCLTLSIPNGPVPAAEQAAFDAALLQYHINKGLTPSKQLIKHTKNNSNYGRKNSHTAKSLSTEAHGVRAPAKTEQYESGASCAAKSKIGAVDDADVQRIVQQASAMAAETNSTGSQYQHAIDSVCRASKSHQLAFKGVRERERERSSAELTAAYEHANLQYQQLAECCRSTISRLGRINTKNKQAKDVGHPQAVKAYDLSRPTLRPKKA